MTNTTSKWVHGFAFLAVVVCFFYVHDKYKSLFADDPISLSTFGTFFTIYGVVFAVIELLRVKNAVELAEKAAEHVFNTVTGLVTSREIIECQAKIESAVSHIDDQQAIPTSALCQILKLYSQIFYNELKDEHSEHRKNKSIIESYANNPNKLARANKDMKSTLLSIVSQLAQHQGNTKNFTRDKK